MAWSEALITSAVLAVPICVVNLILVIQLYRRRSLNKLQNALLFSLGCSDFCAGFFAIPVAILCNIIKIFPLGCKLCIASYLLNRFMMISSLLHFTAIIFDRYLKIVHPFWFTNNEHTLLKGRYIVIPLWLTSLLISLVPLTWWSLETPCSSTQELARNLQNFDMTCLALFCLLLLCMIYAFVRIFLVVRVHLVDINTSAAQVGASMDVLKEEPDPEEYNTQPMQNSSQRESGLSYSQNLRRQLLLKEAKVVIRFASMVLMFIIAWGAYFTISLLMQDNNDVPLVVQDVSAVIRFLNPLFDPWILQFNISKARVWFRDALRVLYGRCSSLWSRIARYLSAMIRRSQPQDNRQSNRDVQVHKENEDGRESVTKV